MGNRLTRLVAPVITTVLLIAYFIVFLVHWASVPIQGSAKTLGIVIPMCLMGVSVYVLVERIKEIRSGEEDDLGKY